MTYISLGEFDDYPAAESFTRAPLDEYKGADHIETECSKTRMCKNVIEQFCVQSSAHQLQWKVEKVKVDTQSSTSHGNQANKTLAVDPKMLQHTGTLYTLW
ncbi:hypothetical protein BBBOND_0104600 [Babesia bigemina]|uniref:Uncharacterized protein n=1 Tax=Babesia bigemina TaxID=5866 RepID=A0A061CZX1_BABBI|nr:hypothetical protein BBBOND_0104600 [Babesia bigemina]CDR94151.1 hypothetical protein BBBOND_0104600 [Babesia bigemina]|eukprot:XP_012766337.1 hypothetical protein BBBOND_0104600 [Babesia bigemina]